MNLKVLARDAVPYALIRAYQLTPGARQLGQLIASGSTSQTALRAISEGIPGWRAIRAYGRCRIGEDWLDGGGISGFSWDQAAPDRF